MATVDEFLAMAGEILKESGFEFVSPPESGSLMAKRDPQSSALLMVSTREAEDGEWLLLIRALAVTNFEIPDTETTFKLLAKLSDFNRELYFGTWYVDPEEPAVVLDHTLLANHVTPSGFAKVVRSVEAAADAVDDQLSEFLSGETAMETLVRVAKERRMI